MKLSEANKISSSITLICKNCEARQPVYVQAMIDKHGADMDLEVVLKAAPCFFCQTAGQFTVFVSESR